MYRAVLRPYDFALHLTGSTDAGKSELAALIQPLVSGLGLKAQEAAIRPWCQLRSYAASTGHLYEGAT